MFYESPRGRKSKEVLRKIIRPQKYVQKSAVFMTPETWGISASQKEWGFTGKKIGRKKICKKSSFYDPRNRIVFQGTARLHSKLVWSEISREM